MSLPVPLTLLLILGITLSPREYCSSQNPYAELVNSICIGSGIAKETYFSIGQLPFRSLYSGTFENHHNSIASGNIEASEKRTLIVNMFAIKTNTDRFLEGWIFITIYIPPGQGRFQLLYVQMEDENGNAVGEFVNKNMCSSKKKKRDVAQPRKVISAFEDLHLPEFYIPCGQVPNSIVFTWHDKLFNNAMKARMRNYFENARAPSSTPLNWRFSHTSCDKPQKIRLRVYIYTDKGNFGTHRSSWINVNWFGAADVLQEGEMGICKGLLIYPPLSPPGPPVRWIKSVDEKIAPTEATSNKDIVRTKKFCKPVYITNSIGAVVEHVPSFGGRCLKHDEYKTSNTFAHECTAGATIDANFTKFSEYLEKRTSCMQINGCPCQCRTDVINTTGIGEPICPLTQPEAAMLGVRTSSPAGKSALRSRKVHGVAMLFVTMVLVPLNIVISRYFKETWLDHAQLKNVQIWYLVHILITASTICLYTFGSVALRRSKNLLGDSLLGESHRGLGWITIAFFILATFSGPFRPMSRSANQKTRKCAMIVHALLGFVYYSMGMAAVMTSSYIPGSPSSSEEACVTSPLYNARIAAAFMPLVVTWMVMDCGFHLIFMLLLRWADNKMNIQRTMYLPLVSILKGGGHHDMKSPLKHCVCQTPGDKVINSICISTATGTTGEYFSIGQMNLRSADSFALHKAHNEIDSGNNEKWATALLIKIFAIKTNADRFLAGRVYIELHTPTPYSIWGMFQYLYFQMEDENGNAIGQFNTSEMLCKGGDIVESKLPTDYFVPCGQVGSAATKASNAVLLAWYNNLRVPKMMNELKSFYGTSTQMAEISVVWGFSHTSCDKPKKIRLRSYITSTAGHLGTLRTSWMEVNWVGASDILKPDEVAICRGELVYPPVGGPISHLDKECSP
ncbi:putative ferric-chelate reductase 1 [Orchesella cincta]|uniref:ascorbate ferrireductase (transmembrane) n=1 Tax=Orchesella cincta TaxID=48709 RepID=A0A1D2MUF5_ORCCI|nr:putative ferric-chelate reductase 1 [Orchesella cincta]